MNNATRFERNILGRDYSAMLAIADARKAENAAARARCLANAELRACLGAESVRRGLGGSVDWAEYFRNLDIAA